MKLESKTSTFNFYQSTASAVSNSSEETDLSKQLINQLSASEKYNRSKTSKNGHSRRYSDDTFGTTSENTTATKTNADSAKRKLNNGSDSAQTSCLSPGNSSLQFKSRLQAHCRR